MFQQEDKMVENEEIVSLINVRFENGKFVLTHNDLVEDLNDRMWLVIRYLKEDSSFIPYKINPNDIIKLGRMKYRVREFRTNTRHCVNDMDCEFNDVESLQELTPEELKEAQCKFCWDSAETDENPKLKPCQCKGSVGIIHYHCLKAWIAQKVITKEHSSTVT